MISQSERRREQRVRFSWPLWFGYEENGQMFRGQITDLTRHSVSFSVDAHHCPKEGDHVLTRFSFPADISDGYEIDNYFHWSEVLRVDFTCRNRCRIAMRLHQTLPVHPAPAEPQCAFALS